MERFAIPLVLRGVYVVSLAQETLMGPALRAVRNVTLHTSGYPYYVQKSPDLVSERFRQFKRQYFRL